MILFILAESFINFSNLSLNAGDTLNLSPKEGYSSYFFLENNNTLSCVINGSTTDVIGNSFFTENISSIQAATNTSVYYWEINSSFCQGPVYQLSTEQLMYIQTTYIKQASANDNSCLFFSNFDPYGEMAISFYGQSSSLSIYYVDSNNTVKLHDKCSNSKCKKLKFEGKPFLIRLESVKEFTDLDIDISLDSYFPSVSCSNSPIAHYTSDQCTKDSYYFTDITYMCSNLHFMKIGKIILLSLLGTFVLLLVIFIIWRSSHNYKYNDKSGNESTELSENLIP